MNYPAASNGVSKAKETYRSKLRGIDPRGNSSALPKPLLYSLGDKMFDYLTFGPDVE